MALVLRNHNMWSAGLHAGTTARQVQNNHTLLALESLKLFHCHTLFCHLCIVCRVHCLLTYFSYENRPSHKIWALKMCLPQYSVNYLPSWDLREVCFLMFVFLTVAQPIGLLNQTCKTSCYFCGAFEGFTLLECYLVPVCSWLPTVWVDLSVPKQ